MTSGEHHRTGNSSESVADQPHLISSINQLQDGVSYILPHELKRVKGILGDTEKELKALGDLRFEAMHQSSETWHDNAPAEAIQHSSEVPRRKRERLTNILKSQFVLEYPSADTPFVTIGSRALIKLGTGDVEPFTIDIVGVQSETPSENPDMEVSTYKAPLAQAIIGRVVGDKPTAIIGDRELEVEIISIDQEAQRLENI